MTFGQPQLSANANDIQAPSVRTTPVRPPGKFTSEIPTDLRDTVTGFITALYEWNVESYRAFEKDDSDETDELIERKYHALIEQWCVDEVTPQGVSFGSDPSHNPETEMLISAATADDKCWVQTEDTHSGSIYEYHLRRVEGKWLVEHLFYVDDEIKYESL